MDGFRRGWRNPENWLLSVLAAVVIAYYWVRARPVRGVLVLTLAAVATYAACGAR